MTAFNVQRLSTSFRSEEGFPGRRRHEGDKYVAPLELRILKGCRGYKYAAPTALEPGAE